MIDRISIKYFKSLEEVSIELGQLNVFIGANGSGKSNLLEAIGILSAATGNKVDDQNLLLRGIRLGVPQLYRSAFAKKGKISPHISLSAKDKTNFYEVHLSNSVNEASSAWGFKKEFWQVEEKILCDKSAKNGSDEWPQIGLAALKSAELKEKSSAQSFLEALQNYVIYTPITSVLRGIIPDTQPREPVGLSGGRLPSAVEDILKKRKQNTRIDKVCTDALEMISWAKNFDVIATTDMPLSPSASTPPRIVRFTDRFLLEKYSSISAYDASEGALYVLLLAVLASHERTPRFFALDNADHGLNPSLSRTLIEHFAAWLLDAPVPAQVLMTTHNPAVLDGLPLQDERVRLFTLDRNNEGMTKIQRVVVNEKLLAYAEQGWTLSRLWTNKLIGGMPDV